MKVPARFHQDGSKRVFEQAVVTSKGLAYMAKEVWC